MNCSRCNRELAEDRAYVYQGKVFCEDCLMEIGLSIKECDPWATYVETAGRKRHGRTDATGLSEMQAKIYEFVKSKGRATREEVMSSLGLSEQDLQAQLVTLMHSELIKERGEGGNLYLVPIG